MKRETTNRIRFILEELMPPLLRDSFLLKRLFLFHSGNIIEKFEEFRRNAPFVKEEDYEAVYENLPRFHGDTDNSQACLEYIRNNVVGESVLDVGCGNGYLLRYLKNHNPDLDYSGADIVVPEGNDSQGISYQKAVIEQLPFPDMAFDTVVCTHTLEHILDIRSAIMELRRVTRHRLILVVPKEREYLFTFSMHFHFFPYPHSFLRTLIPVPAMHECKQLGRDIFYMEDRD